ncbi:Wzz/FepE/Etk N-terminal domain-containing protein [Crenothrix sp.]|uniref:Wzz/FepE/Etk N-terminal domain-containing protein n=1 Tax=Crenothrix sp. TaxID=3100433 RepID=UPI00374CFE43
MNNDNKQGANPSVPPQYFYPSLAQQQNTIKLIDLYRIVLKHHKIILTILLIFTIAGVVSALLKPVIYSFSTTVQIGTLSTADNQGKSELIESSQTALNKIISAYIPFVLAQHYEKNPSDRGRYTINVVVPKNSEILNIEARGAINRETAYKQLINDVVKKLIDDHSRITILKIKNFEVGIAHAENVLASTKDNAKLIAANTERLNKTSELLSTQLKEKKELLAHTLKNRDNVNINNPTGAMSVLLIDSEIQRYQQMIDQVEKYLLIDLNQQRNELEKALSDNLRAQNDEQNSIDQLKNALVNISNTKAVVPVMTSTDSVGLSKTAIMLSFVLLGVAIALAAAFTYEFFQSEMLNKKNGSST